MTSGKTTLSLIKIPEISVSLIKMPEISVSLIKISKMSLSTRQNATPHIAHSITLSIMTLSKLTHTIITHCIMTQGVPLYLYSPIAMRLYLKSFC